MFHVQIHYSDPATTLGTAQMVMSFRSNDRITVASLAKNSEVIDFVGESGHLQFQNYRAVDSGVLPDDMQLSQLVQSLGRSGPHGPTLDLSVFSAGKARPTSFSASGGFGVRIHLADFATSCGTAQIELPFVSGDVSVADLAKDPVVIDFVGRPGKVEFRRYRAVDHAVLPGNLALVQLRQASKSTAVLELSVSVVA